jgi:hypothetical protein
MIENSIEQFITNELNGSFRYITVYLKNKKKYTTGDHKNYSLDQINNDKGNINKFTHYSLAIKLVNIICIDIDELNYDYNKLPTFFNNLPYTLGNTKGRHYYCKLDSIINWTGTENKVFKDFEGDLIGIQKSSNNMWEKKNSIVYNYNNSIPIVSFHNDIKPMLIDTIQKKFTINECELSFDNDDIPVVVTPKKKNPTNKVNNTITISDNIPIVTVSDNKITNSERDVVYDIIDGLNVSRSSDFTSWLNVGYILHNTNYPIEVFDYFSKKDSKYPGFDTVKQAYSKLTKKENVNERLSMNTLWAYLKEDNPTKFKELIKKAKDSNKNNFGSIVLSFHPNEKYNYLTLLKYFYEDTKMYNNDHINNFEISKAYQYFDNFHVWHNRTQSIFLVNPDSTPSLYEKGNLYPNLFINLSTDKNTKKILFSKLWLTSCSRNTTDEFIFNPDPKFVNKNNHINLFTGFEYQSFITPDFVLDQNIVNPYVNHIKHLCKNEENVYNYLLNWIAHLFQKPHKKTTVAILLYSRTQGVGKNIAFDIIHKLLKKYYLKVSNTNNLVDKFNSYQQNKILAVCDEINARTRDIADELKDIITRNQIKIEYKGINSYFIEDYCNYVFTTNNENVIKIDNTDRRMMIIQTPEVKLPKNIIDVLVDILEDDNKLAHIFYYFYNRDISNFYPQQLVTTRYKKILILNDLPPYIKMFKMNPTHFANDHFSPTELFNKSLEFAKANNLPKGYTDRIAYKTFKSLFKDYYIIQNNKRCYLFPEDFEDKIDIILNNFINL